MTPMLWSLLAAIPAVGLEYMYRVLPRPWWQMTWLYVPLSALISFCIYRLVTTPGTPLVGALIIWSFAVIGLRVFVTIALLHDSVPAGTWVALGLMVLARVAQVTWK